MGTRRWAAFVEMYAVHEFAVTSAMRMALSAVSSHALKVSSLLPGVLALAADDRLKSVQASPIKTQWESRHNLFEWLNKATTADLNPQAFPKDGSHFKLQQLATIWKLFGLSGRPVPDRRLLQLVDEIVDNRNAVAHGRERPEDIGRRYAAAEIRKKFGQMGRVSLHVIHKIGDQCADGKRICRP